jgi:serralysin
MVVDLPGNPEPAHSDGNGIIVDDLTNSQSRHPAGIYPFRTLIEGNVCYRNGGRGVHVFLSNHVVVLNNTSYRNNRDHLNPGTWRGELSNVGSSHNVWANNIGVADLVTNKGNSAINEGSTSRLICKDVVWLNNLTFDGRPGSASLRVDRPNPTLTGKQSRNLLGIDPIFLGVEVRAASDLQLRSDSPAIDAGTSAFGVSERDFRGQPRMVGKAVDIGAFESETVVLE